MLRSKIRFGLDDEYIFFSFDAGADIHIEAQVLFGLPEKVYVTNVKSLAYEIFGCALQLFHLQASSGNRDPAKHRY